MRRRELERWCRRDRDRLLADFAARFRGGSPPRQVRPAAVLDDLLTEVLGFDLIEARLPSGQLALCDFEARLVVLSTRLGEAVRPRTDLVALANSTKAHELGHIRLHREELCRPAVTCLEEPPGLRCREENRREQEADLYASTFLIPERMLEEQTELRRIRRARDRGRELSSLYLWDLTYSLARCFQVSPTMMRKRLASLGLVEYLDESRQLRLRRRPEGYEAAEPSSSQRISSSTSW